MCLMAVLLAAIMLAIAALVIESDLGMDVGISMGEEGLRRFFLAVGDHYRVPQGEVIIIRERGFNPVEVPVVLFLANRANINNYL